VLYAINQPFIPILGSAKTWMDFPPTIHLIGTSFQCVFLHSHQFPPSTGGISLCLSIFAVFVFCYFVKTRKSLSCWQKEMCSVNEVGEEAADLTPTTCVLWEPGIPGRDKRSYSSLQHPTQPPIHWVLRVLSQGWVTVAWSWSLTCL
jgi:hypothetical protein